MNRSQVSFVLKPQEYDVLTVAPAKKLPGVKGPDGEDCLWAPVGLTAMFNGGGSIVSSTISDRAGVLLDEVLKGVGGSSLLPPEVISEAVGTIRGKDPDPDCLVAINDNCLVDVPDEDSPGGQQAKVLATAVLRVRGEGRFLCYSSAPPTKLTMREDSSVEQSSPRTVPFEWRDNGELWLTLPGMPRASIGGEGGGENEDGKWILRFDWGGIPPEESEIEAGASTRGTDVSASTIEIGEWSTPSTSPSSSSSSTTTSSPSSPSSSPPLELR